jgi:hypothetical protein
MDTASTCEGSVDLYPTTRRNNTEDSHLHQSLDCIEENDGILFSVPKPENIRLGENIALQKKTYLVYIVTVAGVGIRM